jgi:hypothetical protein
MSADSKTPAQLLAAVLRVVAPYLVISKQGRAVVRVYEDSQGQVVREAYDPTSLSDLARVVAMLDHDQRELFDIAVIPSCSQRPSTTLMLDHKTILAALVAATGVGAERCPSCGVYPADDGGDCAGCEAYREHQA